MPVSRVAGVAAVAAAVLLAAPFVGEPLDPAIRDFVLWQLRVPRTIAGALVGATLALTGATFQAVFGNPLATPSTVGTIAGATLGALVALALVPESVALHGTPVVTIAAFAGAVLVSLAALAAASIRRARMSHVLLAGIAATLAANAVSTTIQSVADMRQVFAATQWSLGYLGQVGYDRARVAAPVVLICIVLLLRMARSLQALAIDEDLAHVQGVHVRAVRVQALGVSALGVASCVAWCGPIAFVGLLVPHLVRLVVGPSQRIVLPLSTITGAAFLVACDVVARVGIPGREIPVGVVTAALGALGLLVLVLRPQR